MNFDSYKPIWLKAGILLALELADRGYKPVEVGLGERDFYVDVESNTTITLDKLKNIKLTSKKFIINENNEIEYNSLRIKIKENIKLPDSDPLYLEILNVSTHHPEPQIQYVRIRGVGFQNEGELKEYLDWLEKVSEIDHRILGEKLDLFSFHEEIGPGIALFHPNGQIIRKELMKFMDEINQSLGYQEVYTSHVMRSILWKISGHYTLYRDKMLIFKHEDEELGVKPMNCPGHILIYKTRVRSYKDLPIRFSEFGHVYRWEKKGELYGLLRVRGFMQDDGHVFLREDQLKDEIKLLISKVIEVLSKFGFKGNDIKINLSTRPDESIGTDEQWEKATKALEQALKELNLNYQIKEKEGAFYGPKIDFEIRDSLGRWWQLSTIQVDFNLPERFNLEYIDRDGNPKRPVMVHRAIYGSIERFMAILIEHFRGKLPTWLCPIQVRIIPVSKDNENYAKQIFDKLRKEGIRVDIDSREETLSKRIKIAYDEGVPYLIIVGRREEEASRITVRARGNVEVKNVSLEEFMRELLNEIKEREIRQIAIERLMNRN